MTDLPIAARIYVGVVIATGLATMFTYPSYEVVNPVLFAVLLVSATLTSALKVTLPLAPGGSSMSVSYAVGFVALLLLGADEMMWIMAASAWSQGVFRPKEGLAPHRMLFNISSLVLTVRVATLVYAWFGGPPPDVDFTLITIAKPLVVSAATYFACNTLLVMTAIGLSTGQSIARVWTENFRWTAPSYLFGATAAAVAAAVIQRGASWVAALAAAPLYLTYRTYKMYLDRITEQQAHVQQVSDLHLATIEALALAIDAKDQSGESHIRRVQVYAVGIAKALGMADNDIHGVKTAALLHDIGKLAVPEHILSKPGPLTQEEFQKIRVHPQVGAEIIAGVPFPYPVAPLILSHHERWDGRGYPSGLKGETIPLGARILTAVDYFDALISERPYHEAMSVDAAMGLLRQESGKALDPRVVESFIELYPALTAEAERSGPGRKLTRIAAPAPHAEPSSGLVGTSSEPSTVFQDIAHAHREIYALYEIAQAMGSSLGVTDTMALISSKLSNIIPVSCCALFLYNEGTESLRCRFATGIDAELIQRLAMRNGEGLAGWVARNRRPLVNARPMADLEAAGMDQETTVLQAALMCPLVFDERFIGTLAVYHTQANIYTDDHRRLLDRISEQAAAVIHNSIIFERTQEESLTDPLTGLPNTRSMVMHLTRELARAERLKAEVALLVIDVDNFKDVNDTFGHHVGDRALREIAGTLRTGIRPYDLCVRYAGDEFIVVMSECGGEDAEQKRVELQTAVDGLRFESKPGEVLPLGISAGAAIFPHDGRTYETLLATADSRMYRDKTRRPRGAGRASAPATPRPPVSLSLSDIDLLQAATGVL